MRYMLNIGSDMLKTNYGEEVVKNGKNNASQTKNPINENNIDPESHSSITFGNKSKQ